MEWRRSLEERGVAEGMIALKGRRIRRQRPWYRQIKGLGQREIYENREY
jgi:hypothetical protein